MALLLRHIAYLATLSLAVGLIIDRDTSAPKRAWVTMAFHVEGLSGTKAAGLNYELSALAASVRKHSNYPLVLITDLSTFEHPQAFQTAMEKLGVQLHDMQHLIMPQKLVQNDRPFWSGAWSKLQMFNMTSWDRLVWLDTDGMLTRSMDYLFEKSGTWSQGDDWFCHGRPSGVCSGLVSFKPDHKLYKGILAYADTLDKLSGGDQQLIEDYFKHIGEPVKLLPASKAAFGQCVNGKQHIPDFIHKPAGYKDCIRSLTLYGQDHQYAEYALNECIKDPMGAAWRETLCGADFFPNDVGFTSFCKAP